MGRFKRVLKKVIHTFMYNTKEPIYIPMVEGSFLKGKSVLITGGSGGIGKAIAYACLKNGANVVICGRNIKELNNTKIELINNTSINSIYTYTLDIADITSFESKIQKISNLTPNNRLDILINNAGVDFGDMIPNTDIESYDATININLKGTYFLSQFFARYMVKNGIRGNILNIASSSGNRPVITPYMYSKWAITGLTKGLAKRFAHKGIVVNGISPGPTATKMLGLDGSNLNNDNSPNRRFADPNEIANLAVFMISDMGRMIIGETVYITGGSGTLTFDDIDYEL